MGNFYTNVVVRGPSEADVVAALESLRRTSMVVPYHNDFVFVYDDEADKQKAGVVESIALTLATRLRCPALASLNHDDDALLLWLYAPDGTEQRFGWGVRFDGDERSPSAPAFAEQVGRAFGTAETPAPYEPVPLRVRLLKFLMARRFAVGRHEQILKRAGLPVTPGLMGYRYVAQGELEERDPDAKVRRVF